ncbi:MAG: alpha/beta hydrolase [Oscillospiraceae bacterium]|jgi:acetyl esterase/lipase|nr:alpha/beta hydrolase [Oscillospiraceae bacterium]
MIYKTLKLRDFFDSRYIGDDATLTVYSLNVSRGIEPERKFQTVLVCPGGGYGGISDREAEPVALAFVNAGFAAAVLRYSCAPSRYPTQFMEASAAMAVLRRSTDWHMDPGKISVCGFSAGGHLAATLGTLWNEPVVMGELGLEKGENRPFTMILCYPVITSGDKAHRGTFINLLGENPESALLNKLSLENSVTADTAPAFIWHTGDDGGVPVENSLYMAAALRKAGVPFELHVYKSGVHGLSLCDKRTADSGIQAHLNPHAGTWFSLAAEWLNSF